MACFIRVLRAKRCGSALCGVCVFFSSSEYLNISACFLHASWSQDDLAVASVGPAAASAGPAAAAAPPEGATEEATQPAEATPAEEVLRQSSAIVSVDPELNREVAAMQPAAGHPTATDTWLLQEGAVPQLDVWELAASAGKAVRALRAHAEQLRSAILEPFLQFWRSRLSGEHVSEIGLFGARRYQLPLGTSDVDVVCHLRPGASRTRHFETVFGIIAAEPTGAFTQVPSQVPRLHWGGPGHHGGRGEAGAGGPDHHVARDGQRQQRGCQLPGGDSPG